MDEQNIKIAKELMEKGWKARENHLFTEAEELLNEAKCIFEQEGDWYNVTECLNHIAYNYKVQGEVLFKKGMDTTKEALKFARDNNTKTVFIDRAILSLSIALGLFENAQIYADKFLDEMKKPADRSDILSHKALIQLRMGDKDIASQIIEEAKDLLDQDFENTTEPHRYIWKSKILMTEALIKISLDETATAKILLQEALDLSKKYNLNTRMDQAELLLNTLNDRETFYKQR